MEHDNPKTTLSPTSLTIADAARLLTKTGGKTVTVSMVEADLAGGAPTNPDGTINLIHYAAWLLQEMHRGE